jgi:hypothetical protein
MRSKDSRRRGSLGAGSLSVPNPGEERKTSPPQSPRVRHPGQLDAGPFAADIASFRLHLAAENKAAGTIRIYTDAARWFAAAHLLTETGKARWEQVDAADVRRWVVWLLGRYSGAYAYQQFRSRQQFFRWLEIEEDLPSPMAKLRPPKVTDKPVPFSAALNFRNWAGAAGGIRSRTGGMRQSSRFCWRRASGCRSWPRSAAAATTRIAVTWTWRPARSGSGARAAGTGPCGSVTRRPVGWTGTCGSGPGTTWRTGPSCGSGLTSRLTLTIGLRASPVGQLPTRPRPARRSRPEPAASKRPRRAGTACCTAGDSGRALGGPAAGRHCPRPAAR